MFVCVLVLDDFDELLVYVYEKIVISVLIFFKMNRCKWIFWKSLFVFLLKYFKYENLYL